MPSSARRRGWLALLPETVGAIPRSMWMLILASVLSAAVMLRPSGSAADLTLWVFTRQHADIYDPALAARNAEPGQPQTRMIVFSHPALERRLHAAFLAQTASADLIESERMITGRAFLGPPESVGFLDLTERIKAEGLDEQINGPSFSPWIRGGRIYGLPHDIHPVVLIYRSDIVEAAGIDVSTIETWDDFERVLAPLMADANGDGEPDRYLLGLAEQDTDKMEVLLLQAGGGLFDELGGLTVATEVNAMVLARIARWTKGKGHIAAYVPDFTLSGNQQKLEGRAIAYFAPDWMCGLWRREIPQLAGKVKVMPLPAWTKGGRRTSVWGGTMIGIPRTSTRPDEAWKVAKHLYLSRELAHRLFEVNDIVSPVKAFWNDPIYDRPDAFFSGQAHGRIFLNLASQVPRRTPSPFFMLARGRVQNALIELAQRLEANPTWDDARVRQEAMTLLKASQEDIAKHIARSAFARDAGGTP